MIELMAAPMAACVILVGIHAYLGMHVIQRKVIFVDLALAQIAALGATFSFLLGFDLHGPWSYLFSLAFAVGGAAIFAFTRMRHERIPQEAIIGIVYAVALATAILVADTAPEGAEHIKETLVGSILWVRWPTIGKTALIYALVGGLHVVLRRRFLQISFAPDQAYAQGRWVRGWDFIFYVTFAFVITSSVAIAGVLMVFSFLVIPAVVAVLYADQVARRLAIGWSVGIAACLVGLVASYRFDLPSGPAVVACLGLALVLAALLHFLGATRGHGFTLPRGVATAAVVLVLSLVVTVFIGPGSRLHIVHQHDWEMETTVGTTAAAATPAQAVPVPPAPPDSLLRLDEARRLIDAGDARGYEIALALMSGDAPPLIRDEAHVLLQQASGLDHGYDPLASDAINAAAMARWRAWVQETSN